MFTIPNLQDPADTKAGRHINPDRSVSPTRDTGFRMPAGVTQFTYNPPVKATNDVFLPEYLHADDIVDLGPAVIRGEKVNAVRLITINRDQHIAREQKYLDESMKSRREREAKENADAAKN